MALSENAKTILNKRYVRRDKDNEPIETPEDVFKRVAKFTASVEETDKDVWEKIFLDLMDELKFLPNSPTLVNAGTPKGSLSACFVMSPNDTMESIMDIATKAVMVEKWGGGVGFGLSRIRPRNDSIATTHGRALGPIGVMAMYSHNAALITQGSFRSGAHMAQLHVSHPDIGEFIHCKDSVNETDVFSNFNISVQISDAFMRAVINGEEWPLVNPRNLRVVGTVSALELWTHICEAAWKTGDPGLSFIDRVRESHVNPHLGLIESSNPCGEENLENFGSCNLGSINLAKHISGGKVDWDLLETTVHNAVRFLDNIIELNTFPVNEIEDMNRKTRRIGLGVMGWADMLMMMDVPYDSKEALDLASSVGKFILDHAWRASAELAQERGPFPEFLNSTLRNGAPVRHSSVTTIAPTGTISRIAGCNSGIEPFFNLAWKSNVLWEGQKDSETTEVVDMPVPVREKLIELIGEEQADMLLEEVAENPTKKSEILAEYGVNGALFDTAMDITPNAHIKHQAEWQKYITNAVSKTINLPKEATAQDISDAYLDAWKLGCKGVTVYRSGSRDKEVLVSGATEVVAEEDIHEGTAVYEGDIILPDGREVAEEETCPECVSPLVYESGCVSCANPKCGYSYCS